MVPHEPVTRRRSRTGKGWDVWFRDRWMTETEARAAGAYADPMPTHTPSAVTRRQGPKEEPMTTLADRISEAATTHQPESGRAANGSPLAGGMNPTERQRAMWQAYNEHGGQMPAARALGIEQGAIRSGLLGYMRAMGIPLPIPSAEHSPILAAESAPAEPLLERSDSSGQAPVEPDPVSAELDAVIASEMAMQSTDPLYSDAPLGRTGEPATPEGPYSVVMEGVVDELPLSIHLQATLDAANEDLAQLAEVAEAAIIERDRARVAISWLRSKLASLQA